MSLCVVLEFRGGCRGGCFDGGVDARWRLRSRYECGGGSSGFVNLAGHLEGVAAASSCPGAAARTAQDAAQS